MVSAMAHRALAGQLESASKFFRLTNLIHTPFRRVDSIDVSLLLDSNRRPARIVHIRTTMYHFTRGVEPISSVDLCGGVVRRNVEPNFDHKTGHNVNKSSLSSVPDT